MVGPAEVDLGFASYKDGSFELIVRDIKTGLETILEGKLKAGQLEIVDRILPTCTYVVGNGLKFPQIRTERVDP